MVNEFGDIELFVGPSMVWNERESCEFEFGEGTVKFSEMIGAVGGTMNDDHGAKVPRVTFSIGLQLNLFI